MRKIDIILDFDGTCVTHSFPNVGEDIGAIPVLKEIVNKGHNLILFTMRPSGQKSYHRYGVDTLQDAVDWFKDNNIKLYGTQTNPSQSNWTNSPKAHGQLIIDDTSLNIPLIYDLKISNRPFVDWVEIEKLLIKDGLI